MAHPRRRPLADPNEYYAYIWRLRGRVIYVGYGKNNRGRPTCQASWSGRSEALKSLLRRNRYAVDWQVIPCVTKGDAVTMEAYLIHKLQPQFNICPGVGSFKGMLTAEERLRISEKMKGNQNRRGK